MFRCFLLLLAALLLNLAPSFPPVAPSLLWAQEETSERSSGDGEEADEDREADGEDEGEQEAGEDDPEGEDGESEEESAPPATVTENTVVDFGDLPDKVTFTFQEAPWPNVLQAFAEWSGLTLDLTDTPPGYFSYYDTKPRTPAEAIDILNGYLLPRGYVILRRDQFLVVLETENEVLPQLVPMIEPSGLSDRGDNELVRMVVPVEEVSPEHAAEEVKGLLGPLGSATPIQSSRAVLVQGFGGSLRQVLQILNNAEPLVTDDKLDFRAFPLKHLPASDAEEQIRALFDLASFNQPTNVSGARQEIDRANYYRSRRGRGDRDRDEKSREQELPLLKRVAMNMQVSSLDRTNSLLVTATPEGLTLIEEILQSIDVPQGEAAANVLQGSEPYLRVYKLATADEEETAKTIDVLIPGVVINEDRREDAIHVFATPAKHREVQDLIAKLDNAGIDGRQVEVIQLRQANPYAMEELLNGMFDNDDRDGRPVIQADLQTRTLIFRGNESQLQQVHQALAAYGEGNQQGAQRLESRFRRIDVGGRSAEAVAEVTKRILRNDDRFGDSIRVVVPGESSDEELERQTRDEGQTQPDDEERDEEFRRSITASEGELTRVAPEKDETTANASTPWHRVSKLLQRPLQETGDDAIYVSANADADVTPADSGEREPASAQQDDAAASPSDQESANSDESTQSSERKRVDIEARGDKLFLYSDDPTALNEVESTIRELMREMPQQTNWTVFYLRAADAEDAALRLDQLLYDPDEYMSYDTPPDDQQVPLRIIPERRTNALFVSGPQDKVEQIEGFLEYIDAVDTPDTFRDREPRVIPVQYANVTDVADMLRELYKDYLTDPAQQARERENERGDDRRRSRNDDDRRRSSSDRRGRPQDGESPGVRLTLAVDERTNELIVSCDETLFKEIEAVVQQRDLRVRESQPTVQFVPLSSKLPANVMEVLEGMSPKIETELIEPPEVESSSNDDRRGRSRRRGRGN